MFICSANHRLRRFVFPLCGWTSLAAYMLLASGLPILIPGASEKDLSQPFPCMNCACGCRNAEQCWRNCCCHTLTERLAWARENQVQPPDYVLAEARAQGIDACDVGHESHCCCCCAKPKANTASHKSSVVLVQALQCSGIASDYLAIGVAIVPVHSDWHFQLILCGLVQPHLIAVASPAFEPLQPPPRWVIT